MQEAAIWAQRNFQRPLTSTGLILSPGHFLVILLTLIIFIKMISKAVGP